MLQERHGTAPPRRLLARKGMGERRTARRSIGTYRSHVNPRSPEIELGRNRVADGIFS